MAPLRKRSATIRCDALVASGAPTLMHTPPIPKLQLRVPWSECGLTVTQFATPFKIGSMYGACTCPSEPSRSCGEQCNGEAWAIGCNGNEARGWTVETDVGKRSDCGCNAGTDDFAGSKCCGEEEAQSDKEVWGDTGAEVDGKSVGEACGEGD